MAGITLDQAQTKLDEYLAAETAVLNNQSYSIAGRSLTRANLKEIQDGITFWNNKVQELDRLNSGRGRTIIMRPRG
jgi:hypothetical protein